MSRRRELSDEERDLWTGVARSVTPLRRRGKIAKPETSCETDSRKAACAQSWAAACFGAASPVTRKGASAGPGAAGPPGQTAGGPRPRPDRRPDRSARTHAKAGSCGACSFSAARSGRWGQDGAGGHRQRVGPAGGRDPGSERGVLKRQVPMWLSLPEFRSFVVGFEDAHVGHGGEGALYVRLRRASKTDR